MIWSGLYIDSPGWIKNRKATINHINKNDNKCFQYVVTVAWNHEKIKKKSAKNKKIKPFINEYNWKEIHFPSEKDDWKNLRKTSNNCS